MKITAAPLVVTDSTRTWGSPVTLTAGVYASPERIIYNGAPVQDLFAVLDETSQKVFDRGNVSSTITFTFTDQKGSFNASERDLILYFASIPHFGKITFYAEGALTTPFAYMAAFISLSHSQVGLSTMRAFTFTGTAITTTPPDP